MSRLASETSRPMVGSVPWIGVRSRMDAMHLPPASTRSGATLPEPRRRSSPTRAVDRAAATVSREVWSARRPSRRRRRSDRSRHRVVVRRLLPASPDQREATFLGDLFRRETVGGAIALVAAVVGVLWANSPWAAAYVDLRHLRGRPARPRALGGRRRADAVLLRGRPGAQARARGRLAAAAGGRGGARRGGGCGVAVPALIYLAVNGGDGGQPRGLGDAGGHRHRLRAGRAGGRGLEPADGAAGVPAHPGRGRRPDRDRDHRGVLHRLAAPRLAARASPARVRGLGAAAAAAGRPRRCSTCRWRCWRGGACTRAASTPRSPASRWAC